MSLPISETISRMEKNVKAECLYCSAVFFLAVLVICSAACSKPNYDEGVYAELQTNKGLIVLRLEFEKTPMTVANFVGLAEGTIDNSAFPHGKPFFDGSEFHRVVPGHVIQGGIPKNAQFRGPGYTFPNEIHSELRHSKAGIMGMANGGPHTNGSQFYITLGDRSYLDGDYTVFGQVAEGLDVVMSIVQGDFIESVSIIRCGKSARRFRPDTENFQNLVVEAEKRIKKAEESKKQREDEFIKANWPRVKTTESGLMYVILQEGQGDKFEPGSVVKAIYTGRTLEGEKTFRSDEEGNPSPNQEAVSFEFILGQTELIPAISEALEGMKKREKRLLIVPSSLAYGTAGFYARPIEGQKRFVISPNTILLIELTLLQ
jgi:cyclophilin family peptidyl-prolyl cis-trans isomerase